MKKIIQSIKELFKMINSSDGLESVAGIIFLCILIPIVLLVGMFLFSLFEAIINLFR